MALACTQFNNGVQVLAIAFVRNSKHCAINHLGVLMQYLFNLPRVDVHPSLDHQIHVAIREIEPAFGIQIADVANRE